MKKKHAEKIILLVSAMLLAGGLCSAALAEKSPEIPYFDLPNTVDTIKVGLKSGTTAVSSAVLENRVGSGYEFGIFDLARGFNFVGYTGQQSITVQGDTGFVLGDGTVCGCWHIMLNATYADFESARSAANSVYGFPASIKGAYRVLVGSYQSADDAKNAAAYAGLDGSAYTGGSSSVIVRAGTSAQIVFMFDFEGLRHLAVRPISADAPAETWYLGNAYRGSFEFIRNPGNSKITLVNYVPLEDYVRGVAPYEMPGSWSEEAIKAQTVCARTYAANNINGYAERGFDVRCDTYSQVYKGVLDITDKIAGIVDSTCGSYVRYRGNICKVYYMSADGGSTESSANVFSQKRAYLSGVADPTELEMDYYNKEWSISVSESRLASILSTDDVSLADIAEFKLTKSELGNVIAAEAVDSNGNSVRIDGEYCFRDLYLYSLRYDVERSTLPSGSDVFVFKGNGWGHNCGMSQWGAYSLAKNYGYGCGDIISFYFSGAYVA